MGCFQTFPFTSFFVLQDLSIKSGIITQISIIWRFYKLLKMCYLQSAPLSCPQIITWCRRKHLVTISGLACCDSWGWKKLDTTEWLNWTELMITKNFPCGSAGKESACNAGDLVWSLGWEDPLEKGKAPHSSGSPLYSPWSCKESDTTEWLSLSW